MSWHSQSLKHTKRKEKREHDDSALIDASKEGRRRRQSEFAAGAIQEKRRKSERRSEYPSASGATITEALVLHSAKCSSVIRHARNLHDSPAL